MLGAACATLLWAAGATSALAQSSVDNDQSQSGDVLANGQLNVVYAEEVDQTVNALGSGYTAQATSGQLNVVNAQELTGNVRATARIDLSDYAYDMIQSSTATGNSGQADSLGYGDMGLTSYQRVGPVDVTTSNTVEATNQQIDFLNASSQAVGNSHAFSQIGAANRVDIDQANEGLVQADGAYSVRYSQGEINTTASSVANNVTGAGVDGATQDITVNQEMNGARTQASQYVSSANAQSISSSSTAVANNISISNSDNPLSVASSQTNNAYVRAETDVYANSYGGVSSNAMGVANSSSVIQIGEEITVDNNQVSTSGVEVLASFTGGDGIGYDSETSSTAIGNASSAYACTSCGEAKMTITNRQNNSGSVRSTSTTTIGAEGRRVTNAATAVGNSATYYVSQQGE